MRTKKIICALAAALICLSAFPFSASAGEKIISVGKEYTLEYFIPIDNAYPKLAYQPEKKLTDGKTAGASYNDANWLTLYRGSGVTVTVDLGAEMAVSGVKMGSLQLKSYGVYCTRYMRVALSADGENYCEIGVDEDSASITSGSTMRVEHSLSFEPKKARYVRVSFSSDVFTMVDEISVSGDEDASSAAALGDFSDPPADLGYASPIDGIKHICLMYIASNYTEEMLKPYCAYVDSNKKAAGTMFDSLLFLELTNTSSPDKFMRMDDMKAYLARALGTESGLNMAALDKTVASLKSEGIFASDYKYPVFISTPFVGVFNDSFGEHAGRRLSASTLAGREEIVDWFIDYTRGEFAAAGFENLELKGFYWFAESINYSLSEDEPALVRHFTKSVRDRGYKSLWIPYFSSMGVDIAPTLGFDAVVMQSGYAFKGGDETGAPKPGAVTDCAAAAKKLGMGLEFEVDMNVPGYYEKFAQYVHVAYSEGLMTDGIIAMYQVGTNLYTSSAGTGSARALYELTHDYCTGAHTESAPVIKEGATVTLKSGEYFKGKLEITDEDTAASKITVCNLVKPAGVSFNITGRGVFEVEAYKSEPGTYVASFSVTDGFNESNTVEVTIIVEPGEDVAESSSPAGESEDKQSSAGESADQSPAPAEDGGINVWLIVAIAAAVVAAAAAVIIVIRSKTKTNKGAQQ